MKLYLKLLSAAAVVAGLLACSRNDADWVVSQQEPSRAPETMESLWKTSPLDVDDVRRGLFSIIQSYADTCASMTFSRFLEGEDWLASSLVRYNDILACYNAAFDRVLDALADEAPADGEVHIWMLYNMGYVVRTASGSFGIDIYHRRGAELAPYLDFYASTHVHQDHRCDALADAMLAAGKPVLTNYLDIAGYEYTSGEAKDYSIGNFSIHSFITNHNNGESNVPVTVFRIDCGADAGNLVLMNSGDSNFLPGQYASVKDDKIDIYIPRYAPNELTENNVIGQVFTPDYVLLSHILELSHSDPDSSRWTLEQGLTRASLLDCDNTYMPFWGEKLVWKDGKLQ